jgi:hypothetical protein
MTENAFLVRRYTSGTAATVVRVVPAHGAVQGAQVQNTIGWIVAPGRVTKMTNRHRSSQIQ